MSLGVNSIKPPEELKLTENVNENRKVFKQRFELYLLALGLEGKEDRRMNCRKCGGKNHFAKCCFTKNKVQTVKKCPESEDDTVFFIGTLADEETNNKDEWIACIDVNGTEIPFKLDTGAQVNILPSKELHRLKVKPKVQNKQINLRTYNDEPIRNTGMCRATLSLKAQSVDVMFVIVDGDRQPTLGLKTCKKLGLIKRVYVIDQALMTSAEKKKGRASETYVDMVDEYQGVLKGIGRLPGNTRLN